MKENKEIISVGLKKYFAIMNEFHKVDVSKDKDFQRKFNSFYRVRLNKDFRKCFFDYMELQKNNKNLTFIQVMNYLYENTGIITPSFSSKMLATVNPEMPVWDSIVLKNLGFKQSYGLKDRLAKNEAIYNKICEWYKTPEALKKLENFNKLFPESKISDVKKIDFILWSSREEKDL